VDDTISGLSLKWTIGLGFAAVILLVAVAMGFTYSFNVGAQDALATVDTAYSDAQDELRQSREMTSDSTSAAAETLDEANSAQLKVEQSADLSKELVALLSVQKPMVGYRDELALLLIDLMEIKSMFVGAMPGQTDLLDRWQQEFQELDGQPSRFNQQAVIVENQLDELGAVLRRAPQRSASSSSEYGEMQAIQKLLADQWGAFRTTINENVRDATAELAEAKKTPEYEAEDTAGALDTFGQKLSAAINPIRKSEGASGIDLTAPHYALIKRLDERVSAEIESRTEKVKGMVPVVQRAAANMEQLARKSKERATNADEKAAGALGSVKNVAAKLSGAQAAAKLPSLVSMILLVVIVFTSILLTFITTRSVNKPIVKLARNAKRIAAGDISRTMRCDRTDMIGELTDAFNQMVREMNGILYEAQGVSDRVASSASVLTSSAREVMEQMDQQARGIGDAVASVGDVAKKSAAILDQTTAAADASDQASEESSDGRRLVEETMEEMERISQSVRDASEILNRLGIASNEIATLVTTISEIADQTNLLALNAAIEAARAGEHGRGFAVVADEVRKLAEKVSSSADEIISMIKTIQNESDAAVRSMQESAKLVQRGVGRATNAGQSLGSILGAVQRVANLMTLTEAAAKEQAHAADRVRERLKSLASHSSVARDSAHATSAEASEMMPIIQNLDHILKQFRLAAGGLAAHNPHRMTQKRH